jgi:putative hydrolases of HD superfamily
MWPVSERDLEMENDAGRLERQLRFILEIDKLKSVLRQTRLVDGSRRENDAEHCWEVATMAIVLAEHAGAPIDLARVVRMLLIHDIVEIDAGDTFIYDEAARKTQVERERRAAERLFGLLPDDQAVELRELWAQFEDQKTAESRFARALDRLQPLLHNYHSGGALWSKHGLDHGRVTERNEIIACGSPMLWAYAQEVLKRAVDEGLLPE